MPPPDEGAAMSPDEMAETILAFSGLGFSTREVAARITDGGYPISHMKVARVLRAHR